jgi:hypothetical protein
MRILSKIVTIPSGQTNAQLETLLNTQLSQGWSLVLIATYSSRQIAVFQKKVAE